jgi:3-hydroxyisobutyrate dehydrogenase-like beta-hydroxyacid dehydrogenase
VDAPTPTVGILYAGEMGAALGRALRDDGLRVVTTLEGRGPRTQRLCREAGLEELASLCEVVAVAEVVVSVVPPSAAVDVARSYASLAGDATGRLYIDANAVSPATAAEVGLALAGTGVGYIDAAINGLASALHTGAILYLSGGRAAEAARLFGRLRVQVVGAAPGQASALKGVLAGLSKGLAALFVELAVLAREAGLAAPFLERCRSFYPGVLEVAERMLPTYPRHARRRAEEMAELEGFLRGLGLRADMVSAAGRVTQALADAGLGDGAWTAEGVLEALHRRGALRAPHETGTRQRES